MCTDLREGDPIRDNEDKKSPMAVINMLLQIETGLEAAADEASTHHNFACCHAGH